MFGFIKKVKIKEFFKRDIALSLAFALVFSVFFSLAGFDSKCEKLRRNILRLHILANSDSDADQALKLRIRDEILKVSEGVFENADNKENAISIAEKNLKLFKDTAQQVINKSGECYQVEVVIGKSEFNTRKYDNFTLPAGEYDAVKVLIGNAQGKNWWCVMFPSMCVSAAGEKHSLEEAVDETASDVAKNFDKYEIKFKSVEIYETFKKKINVFFS